MRNLIILELSNAIALLEKQLPLTKKETKNISIIDVRPLDLTLFMEKNNIPNNASFGGRDNGYDAWDDIVLTWEVDVPTTDKDKLVFKRKRFTDIAWKFIYNSFINSGYRRVGFNSGLLKEFDDTTVYDMYINKDFDRLEKYYSLRFTK